MIDAYSIINQEEVFAMEIHETKKNQKNQKHDAIYTKDIARAVQERTGYSLKEIENIIKVLEEVIIYEIFQLGRRVIFQHFGTFWCKTVKAPNNNIYKLHGQKPKKTTKQKWAITFITQRELKKYLGEIKKQQ